MATGYAKTTGKLGVCLATSGGGAIHLLNGLYDAKLDHIPVLAITGMQGPSLLGTGYQQEVHTEHLYADVAEYNAMVHIPGHIPTLVDKAVRTALSRRTVSHITFPVDIQEAAADFDPWSIGAPARLPETAPTLIQAPGVPDGADLQRAAAVLNEGSKVVMLVGAGALGAREQVLRVAECLGSPIVKTLSGKAVVPDDHPLTTGGLGLLGTKPTEDVMDGADTLFMVGTNFPFTEHLPKAGIRTVQIEADPTRAGDRIPTEVPLVGDAQQTLQALLPLLQEKTDRSYLDDAQTAMANWRGQLAALEGSDRDPIQPQYLMRTVDRLADDDAILSTDSGTIATWAARHYDIRGDREFMLSGNLATMAPGLPYTIAAQFAHPNRQCIAFIGDGGFAMLMAEFLTACRLGLPIKVVIDNNALYGQILWEQMALGFPEHGVRWERPADFSAWAQSCGGLGISVKRPADVEGAVSQLLAHPGPALIDVAVNPDEPPMPAKVTYEQAKGFAKSFLRGQPRRAAIASTLFRDKIHELRG